MTKAELIASLADLPDTARVLLEPWPERAGETGPQFCDLYSIADVNIFEDEGLDAPAFASIVADLT